MKKFLSVFLALCMLCSFNVHGATIEVPNILEHPGDHRPVPTEFEKSSALDDLYYFPMASDPETTFASLSGGVKIIDHDDLFYEGATVEGEKHGKIETVAVEGMHFDKALRITTETLPERYSGYNYRIWFKDFEASKNFKDGDMLLARFYVRRIEGGDIDTDNNKIQTYFCDTDWTGGKDDGRAYRTIEFRDNWEVAYVPLKMIQENIDIGYLFSINPVYHVGIIEVGGLEIYHYSNQYNYSHMPQSNGNYKGSEEDAQWRKEANERIEKHRKGDVEITVKDQNGNPVPDAKVEMDMYEHEFDFSVAAGSRVVTDKNYREAVVKNFNHFGVEGGFHRRTVNNDENTWYDYNDAYADFIKNNGLKGIHGHALIWDTAITGDYAKAYESVYQDKDALQAEIRKHFEYMAKRFPWVTVWDVSNEDGSRYGGLDCTYKNLHGKEILIDWYKWARELFPNATLMLTDGYSKSDAGSYETRLKPFLEWAVNNLDFDEIGVHGHVGYKSAPEDLVETLQDVAKFGKPIKVTEFDTHGVTEDVNFQANIVRDGLIAYFSIPEVNMIQIWGFWNSSPTELQHRFIYNYDWTLKPGGVVYQDLVYNKWWTREDGVTDADGKYSLRAFYGDYDIKVTHNGVTKLVSVPLYKGAENKVEIILDTENNSAITYIKKNDSSFSVVATGNTETLNDSLVIAEFKDGKLIGMSASNGETIINREEFLIADYEKKDPSSTITVLKAGNTLVKYNK